MPTSPPDHPLSDADLARIFALIQRIEELAHALLAEENLAPLPAAERLDLLLKVSRLFWRTVAIRKTLYCLYQEIPTGPFAKSGLAPSIPTLSPVSSSKISDPSSSAEPKPPVPPRAPSIRAIPVIPFVKDLPRYAANTAKLAGLKPEIDVPPAPAAAPNADPPDNQFGDHHPNRASTLPLPVSSSSPTSAHPPP